MKSERRSGKNTIKRERNIIAGSSVTISMIPFVAVERRQCRKNIVADNDAAVEEKHVDKVRQNNPIASIEVENVRPVVPKMQSTLREEILRQCRAKGCHVRDK